MRTTVTLDADVEVLVRRRMRERGVSFKEALNAAVREGVGGQAGGGQPAQFRTEAASLGLPAVRLDRALQLAGELEDEELLRKRELGK